MTGLAGAVAGATRFGRGTRAAATDPTGLMGRTPESVLAQAVGTAAAPVMQYVPGGTERLVVREGEGFRTLFLINDKTSLHEAVIDTPPVPDGGTIDVNTDGTASIVDTDGTETARMAAPWAYDANGRPVPTRYVVRDGHLIQQVYADADTAYPILADPNEENRKGPRNANKETKSDWKTDQDTAGGQFLSGNQVDQVRQNAQSTSNTASGAAELMGQAQNATPTPSLAETGTGSPATDVVYANQIDQPVTSDYGGGTTATMYPTGHESGVAATYRTGPDSNGTFEEGVFHEEGGQSRSRLTPVPGYPDSYDIVTENPDHTVTVGRRTPDGQGGYTLWTSNPDGSHTMLRDGVGYTVPAGMDPTQAAPVVSRTGTDGVIYTRSQNPDGTVSEAVSHPMPGGRVMAFITTPDDTVSVAISGPIDENGRNDTTIQHPNGNATLITKDDRFIGLDPDGRPTDLFDENYQMGTRWNPWTDQWEVIDAQGGTSNVEGDPGADSILDRMWAAARDVPSTTKDLVQASAQSMLDNPAESGLLFAGLIVAAMGATIEGGGVVLDATGVGAVIGIPANALGAAMMTGGVGLATPGVAKIGSEAYTNYQRLQSGRGGGSAPDLKSTRYAPNGELLGTSGPKIDGSKTASRRGLDYRIDIENPDPGGRPGQMHLQDSSGGKYYYNFNTNEFEGLPKSLLKKFQNGRDFQDAVDKGAKLLGVTN